MTMHVPLTGAYLVPFDPNHLTVKMWLLDEKQTHHIAHILSKVLSRKQEGSGNRKQEATRQAEG